MEAIERSLDCFVTPVVVWPDLSISNRQMTHEKTGQSFIWPWKTDIMEVLERSLNCFVTPLVVWPDPSISNKLLTHRKQGQSSPCLWERHSGRYWKVMACIMTAVVVWPDLSIILNRWDDPWKKQDILLTDLEKQTMEGIERSPECFMTQVEVWPDLSISNLETPHEKTGHSFIWPWKRYNGRYWNFTETQLTFSVTLANRHIGIQI